MMYARLHPGFLTLKVNQHAAMAAIPFNVVPVNDHLLLKRPSLLSSLWQLAISPPPSNRYIFPGRTCSSISHQYPNSLPGFFLAVSPGGVLLTRLVPGVQGSYSIIVLYATRSQEIPIVRSAASLVTQIAISALTAMSCRICRRNLMVSSSKPQMDIVNTF